MSRQGKPLSDKASGPAAVGHQTIVGIGASAGGLAALKKFLAAVPPDNGVAWVVIVHLSPEHRSHLAELLQPHTTMPVQQVIRTTKLEPGNVYVIPPNADLSSVDTHLRLTQRSRDRQSRAPIDHFLRTLADTHDGDAVGVILTGTGSDGALGVKAIKEKGGLVLVQDPAEAEFDGMPQSAISTGLVDLVLPLAAIPDAVLAYATTHPRLRIPPEDDQVSGEDAQLLHKLFTQLRARTGRDFSRYKRATVARRIGRRMQLRRVERFDTYLELVRREQPEAEALAEDLLINVTSFFRDREVYDRLQADIIPALFEGRRDSDQIRVWVVGCATGEEAYSLGMLLLEEAARRPNPPPSLQVFASDLHERSLEKARDGLYAGDIEQDVSRERLRRFFLEENGGYRVRQELRELVVFAPHNLLADPPFSRLDLITCRNVLIYLQKDVQDEVMELFHYALRPDGVLVLGTSETVATADLFRVEDKKASIYRKRNVPPRDPRLPVFPMTVPRQTEAVVREARPSEPASYGLLHQRLVERLAPPSVLVNADDRVVHLSEHAGRYLIHPGGEPTASIGRLVREELRVEVRAALHEVRESAAARRSAPIPVRFNGEVRDVVLDVRPSPDPDEDGFVLIMFDERPAAAHPEGDGAGAGAGGAARVRELESELLLARQRLRAVIDKYETSREEMRASNEELQSTNEELRSTMEELETSKEELQSMNEELQTVNQENRHKVEELGQLSSDLQNLLAATEIATLFLDRQLRILRFTPKVGELFNVRVVDRGRPLSDLTHRLGYDELAHDAARVLERLVPVEREVRAEDGSWYLTRLRPYRTRDDRIDGVVITFVDVTERKRYQERLERMINIRGVGVLIFDAAGRVVGANDGFLEMTGYTRADVEQAGLTWRVLTPPEYHAASEAELARLAETGRIGPYEKEYLLKDGTRSWMLFAGASLGDGTVIEYCIDTRDWKRAETALRESEELFRTLYALVPVLLWRTDPGGGEVSLNPRWFEYTGQTLEQTHGGGWLDALHPDDREHALGIITRARAAPEPVEDEQRVRGADGIYRWFLVRQVPLCDPQGRVTQWFGAAIDIDARKQAESARNELNEALEVRVAERTAELARATAALREEVRHRADAERARLAVLRQLVGAEDKERRRISRELHDSVGQLVTGLLLGLRALRREAGQEAALADLERIAERIAHELRHMAVELRPPALDSLGLVEALQDHVAEWSRRYLIEADFHAAGTEGIRLAPELETTLYRIAQEALTNVLKHANARHISVLVERRDGTVSLIIEDNGRGFDADAVLAERDSSRMGLRGIRERLALVDGTLEVESSDAGTTIYARVPERTVP